MAKKIAIDPITRIEGHLKMEVEIEDHRVVDAKSSGTLFRGFENILKGRDPRDAQHLVQRVCGVCPASHATAAALNLDNAFEVTPPANARIMRNLILGANFIQSHILHFYHLAALDYVTGPDTPPFVPRYEGDYRLPKDANDAAVKHYKQALEIRMQAHEMLAVLGGKMPHLMSFTPGGVTEEPDADEIAYFSSLLKELSSFIDNVYIPDVLTVADAYQDYFNVGVGCKNLLAYGAFDLNGTTNNKLFPPGVYTDGEIGSFDPQKIAEEVKYSWYAQETTGKNPQDGVTEPEPGKPDAYSWLKSPRYGNKVHEAGPSARMAISYLTNASSQVKELIDSVLAHFGVRSCLPALLSVMGRHAARVLECKFIADSMKEWLEQLVPGDPVYTECKVPTSGEGMGLTEAPRGALGHWIKIRDHKIGNYQIITPTNWNVSPRDDRGKMGPIEQALIGTPVMDSQNPIEVVRVVRSFDPCLACSVHLISPKRKLGTFKIN